jgi:hypothetical protein
VAESSVVAGAIVVLLALPSAVVAVAIEPAVVADAVVNVVVLVDPTVVVSLASWVDSEDVASVSMILSVYIIQYYSE